MPAIDKIWLKSYPKTVPHEIDLSKTTSIGDMISAACRQFNDKPAFTCMGKDLSYKDLDENSRALAAWLQSRGLVKGDRVAVMMPNILQYPITIAAVLRAGLVVVNVNPLYTPRELQHQLNDSGAKALIVLENFAATVQKSLASIHVPNIIVASMGDMHGLKGHIINLVVRKVKKLVPAWSILTMCALKMRSHRVATSLSILSLSTIPISHFCNIPAAQPASQRARC